MAGIGDGSAAATGGATASSPASMVGCSIGVGARTFAPERSRTLAIDGGGAGSEGGLSAMGTVGCVTSGAGLGAISGAASGIGMAGARSAVGFGADTVFEGGLAPGFLVAGLIAGAGASSGVIGSVLGARTGGAATAATSRGAAMVALSVTRGGPSTRCGLKRTPYRNSVWIAKDSATIHQKVGRNAGQVSATTIIFVRLRRSRFSSAIAPAHARHSPPSLSPARNADLCRAIARSSLRFDPL